MNHVYYLFSKTNRLEAIYICENDKYIDQPNIKTNVYNMGTLLSCAVKILTPWYESGFNLFLQKELIHTGFVSHKEESSFSYVTESDDAVRGVFVALLQNQNNITSEKNFDKVIQLLLVFMKFINKCYDDSYYCYSKYFEIISAQCGYNAPPESVYASRYNALQSIPTKENIDELLKMDGESKKVFDPAITQRPRALFDMHRYNPFANQFGTLEIPIHTYEVHDIADFIAVSLKCILKEHYVMAKCKYCGDLFVTHNKQRKYCHNQANYNKSCQEKSALKNQLFIEKNVESRKSYKNIAKMLGQKLGTDSKEYRDFLDGCNQYRNEIKSNNSTEDDYIAWMKQYWEDVKLEYKRRPHDTY